MGERDEEFKVRTVHTERGVCGRGTPMLAKGQGCTSVVECLPSLYKALDSILGTHKTSCGMNYSSTEEAGGPEIQNSRSSSVNLRPALRYMR